MSRQFRLVLTGFLVLSSMPGQTQRQVAPNLNRQPTLYVVPYAHLDTQWNWDFKTTITDYLPKTMRMNFDYFEKYPHYIFNFTGANRYRLMREYYPTDYARLKQYVTAGRWFPAGSSFEEGDVNSPSAEAIFREILYGNSWFRHEFGKASAEYMLPDCFGFPASLPSILAHAGIKGFSTQKLSATWQPAPRVGGPDSPEKTPEGIPFNVGIWEGPDGKTVLAALNPLTYTSTVDYDLSKTPPAAANADTNSRRAPEDWPRRIQIDGERSGIFADYHYVGTGDTGGAVNEASAKLLESIVAKDHAGDGPVHVVNSRADQMFLDILECCKTDRMPRYKGDLELINHSAGSLTSQAYHKRWNRRNEVLADAAEKASVAAAWLGGRPYPQQRLNNAWTLVMGGHFHDTMAGTASPTSYEFAWNDDAIAMNQFAGVLTSASAAVVSAMNTQVQGVAIAVYNPLVIPREDVVEAAVSFTSGMPKAVRVVGPDGKDVPAQIAGGKVLFLAKAPPAGYAIYDVQPADAPPSSTLKVSESSLENARYRVRLNQSGDVSSIFDKLLNRELLSAPMRLAFQTERPTEYPSWNMDWADQQKPPRAWVQGPAKVRIVENGPVRVALEVERESEGSRFVETVRLSAGDAGNRVEFTKAIDWKTSEAALKTTLPLTASNPEATYNWDIGTVRRHNNEERQFEVASHQWVDLTDKSGAFGVTLLTDTKYGSDKPNDNTLRLTLIYTPGLRGPRFSYQAWQDWGHHEIEYGIAGHAGDWRQAQTDWQAYRLNQPLMAFESTRHSGALGREFSLARVSDLRARVLAVKKAEESDEIVLRLVETAGQPVQNLRVTFAAPVTEAREINAQEQPLGTASVVKGELVASFGPYQPRTFALRLAPPRVRAVAPQSQPVPISYERSVASRDGARSASGFDAAGRSLPAEMLPDAIDFDGIQFRLASPAGANALVPHGQSIRLPAAKFNRAYVLAASADGDQKVAFHIGDGAADLNVQNWGGFIGQWDDHIYDVKPKPEVDGRLVYEYRGLRPGFMKRADLAWYASHRHTAKGANEPYAYSYLFAYVIDAPAGARTLTLPDNDRIRILAITVAEQAGALHAAQPLYDTLERNGDATTSRVRRSGN